MAANLLYVVNKMDKYLKAENTVSEIDLLVEADENLLVVDSTKKMNRANRRRTTALNKKRMKNLATYSVAEIRSTGKVKNYHEKHYYKGFKAWSKKVRHEKWYELPEEAQTATGVTIDDEYDDTEWFLCRINAWAEATKFNRINIPARIRKVVALQDEKKDIQTNIDLLYGEIKNLKIELFHIEEEITRFNFIDW